MAHAGDYKGWQRNGTTHILWDRWAQTPCARRRRRRYVARVLQAGVEQGGTGAVLTVHESSTAPAQCKVSAPKGGTGGGGDTERTLPEVMAGWREGESMMCTVRRATWRQVSGAATAWPGQRGTEATAEGRSAMVPLTYLEIAPPVHHAHHLRDEGTAGAAAAEGVAAGARAVAAAAAARRRRRR